MPHDATQCHTMPRDAVRSSHPRERQLRLLLVQDLQEAGASPQLQAGSRRVQDQCQAEEGCLACLGWHGTAVPLLLSPLTSGCPQTHPTGGGDCPPWGGEQVCTASGPAPLPSGRWKTSRIHFLYHPKPLLVCGEPGIDGGCVYSCSVVQISRPQTQELADPNRPAAQRTP